MNKKTNLIWISGSRGFLGKNLKDLFLQDDHYEIKCLSNNKGKSTLKIEKNFISLNFDSKGDIQKILDKNQIPDIFIHVGWGGMENPHSDEHIKSNVKISKNLIEMLFKAGLKKFIFLGSITEYGEISGCVSEEMPSQGTLSNYAKGKKEVSVYGFENAKITKKIFIHIRLSYVYGPTIKKESLIQTLFVGHRKKSNIFVGSCQQFRDYIHISEAVEGIKRICNINQSITVNLGSGKSIKLRNFVELFWKNLTSESKKLYFDSKPHNNNEQAQPNCYLDLKKLKEFTNWYPTLTINKGIIQTINELHKLE